MAKIAIITDSTAYLKKEYVKKHNIRVIPLNLHWDGDTFKDGVDISPDEFYNRLKASSTLPTTSQPTYGDFQAIFNEYASDYDGIIVALISSGISGTVDSALMAQKSFKEIPVEVIDTKTTAGGQALIVKAIAASVESGKSLQEVASLARAIVAQICTYFMVDTLKYLHKGGRIGGASRYFGTALNIKPILYLNEEGKIDALEKVRTKKKAVSRLLELAVEKAAGKKCYVGVYHAQALKEAEAVRDEIQQNLDCYEVGIYKISPVIGTHVGPGALGISVHTVAY